MFAHERAVDNIEQAQQLSRTRYFWIVDYLSDYTGWDWLWEPVPWQSHQRHAWPSQHQLDSGTYLVPKLGYAETNYHTDQTIIRLPSYDNWEILEKIDDLQWDWSWHPNASDPAYIYDFGNQWNPPEYKASVRYHVSEATETKYISHIRTVRLPQPGLFRHNLAVSSFDYSWEPNPFDPPMTYVFGNQWNPAVLEPTVIYDTPTATEIKYIDDISAVVAKDMSHWQILDDIIDFDYSWRPNPTDPPYIYIFGNQWLSPEQRPALKYVVPGATDIKYMDEPKAVRVADPDKFETLHECDFDYSWEPDPGSPPYDYVFGNQWWPAEIMPTVRYNMLGATDIKYIDQPMARLPERHDNHWETVIDCEWDYSWIPDPGDPPYIYVFGNQWYSAEVMPTVKYHVAGATQEKYLDYPAAKLLPSIEYWSIPEEVDRVNIDFSWVPHPNDDPYIHHFGSEYQVSVGLTYTVPGATELKFEGEIPLLSKEKKAIDVVDMFFIDRSNAMSNTRFQDLQERYPHIQRVRYVNSIMDTINRCLSKSKTNRFWVIGSENVYDNFDFAWHAQPWQSSMTHVFGSQWNKWSDTFLINKWEFERHAKWAKGIEQFPNLNFVSDQTVTAPADAADIYVIDHGNSENKQVLEFLQQRYRVVKQARYFDNYLDTLKRLLQDVSAEHVWVVSSICDYSRFDFSWQPEAWQRDMLHVFPSKEQKFGDTFYVPVAALRNQITKLELLDWFDTINYCNDQCVPRWDMPVFIHQQDSHVDFVKTVNVAAPLVLISNREIKQQDLPTVNLWREKTKTIVPLDAGGTAVIVPRTAIGSIQQQFYDYPYIDKSYRRLEDHLLDIVFLSNGEPNAGANWHHLQNIAAGRGNRCIRIDGVNGRSAAYKAAAAASETPWFFSVFAKLEIDPTFDFTWQPDRMQQAKHYIFNSRNPVNGLEYGHQGLIAYNKKLVLATEEIQGLDFTLSQPHGVEPILSGVAHYNSDPWSTWRTAFREVVKLRHYYKTTPDVETEYRLDVWQKRAEGDYAEWSLRGAQDAMDYYDSVSGNYDSLLLTFEWAWLRDYFNNLTT